MLQYIKQSQQAHEAAASDAAQQGTLVVSIAVVAHPQRVVLATGSCIYLAEVCSCIFHSVVCLAWEPFLILRQVSWYAVCLPSS